MKTIIFGDMHGRLVWYDIIKKEQPDKTIFLGDYVSTHDADISEEQQCCNLEDILNYKTDNPNDVVLLRGNHDMQHLGYHWAQCSGLFLKVRDWLSESNMKQRFLDNTQWVYVEDNFVFSHAGISKEWWNYLNLGDATKDNLLKINELEPSALFGFTPNRYSDYTGDSYTQPCTWIRPFSLLQCHIDNWNQVVGHTRVATPGNILVEFGKYSNKSQAQCKEELGITMNEFWCIDALPFQYMVIEDGKREMRKF